MSKPFDPNHLYNEYRAAKGDDFERKHRTKYVSDLTRRAFEELEFISSWAEFVAICEEQKRKRGW